MKLFQVLFPPGDRATFPFSILFIVMTSSSCWTTLCFENRKFSTFSLSPAFSIQVVLQLAMDTEEEDGSSCCPLFSNSHPSLPSNSRIHTHTNTSLWPILWRAWTDQKENSSRRRTSCREFYAQSSDFFLVQQQRKSRTQRISPIHMYPWGCGK